MNAIHTEDLTKYYGKSRGIIQVNLNVPEGDFFGFIGPNGAGKSTTIRILLGLISASGGTAELFGKNIRDNKEEILSLTGYMPSEASFYGNMKTGDLIRYSADLRGLDCSKEASELCHRLDLNPEKKISTLSLGNKKKLSIVCALQHKPRLCILDEPTSGLDPLIQKAFFEILEERNKEGATIFLSSHVLSEIQRHCRHGAVIREGKILISDSIEKLGESHAKRVTVRGIASMPVLDSVKDTKVNGDTLSFLYTGKPDALLKTLGALPLTDITITEPDLEEVFLHYYT